MRVNQMNWGKSFIHARFLPKREILRLERTASLQNKLKRKTKGKENDEGNKRRLDGRRIKSVLTEKAAGHDKEKADVWLDKHSHTHTQNCVCYKSGFLPRNHLFLFIGSMSSVAKRKHQTGQEVEMIFKILINQRQ